MRTWPYAALTFAFFVVVSGVEPATRAVIFAVPRMIGVLAAAQILFLLLNVWQKAGLDLLWEPVYQSARFVRGVFMPMMLFGAMAALAIALFHLPPTAGQLWVGDTPLPPPEAFGSLIVVLGTGMVVEGTLGSLGYPPAVYGRRRKRYKELIRLSFSSYTVTAAALAGKLQQPVQFAIGLAAVMTLHAIWMTRGAARAAYFAAPVAKMRAPLRGLVGRPRFFQVTDLHLTAGEQQRAEGGSGGNDALRARLPGIVVARPAFALLTGDVTDHGAEDEWDEAVLLLEPLRSAGCRLLLVPGNHDLSPAYDTAEASYVVARAWKNEDVNWLRSARLRRYLERAAVLDPSLTIPGGRTLKDMLEKESKGFVELDAVIARARQAVKAGSATAGPTIASTWESARRIFDDLLRERLAIDEPLTQEWLRLLLGGQKDGAAAWETTLRSAYEQSSDSTVWHTIYYENAWWDYFPLHTFDGETGSEIFLLNSVSPFVDMFGSAWGNIGEMQVARLEQMLAERYSAHVIILIHHAPFRWEDEPPPRWRGSDIQRWAFLAAAGPAMNRFVRLLEDTRRRDREVIVFCGHRHGGLWHQSRVGDWPGGIIAEGASLADTPNAAILCAWMGDQLRLELGKLRQDS